MFVRIGDAFVVFLAILVFIGVRIWIAASPEFFDKALALVVGLQFLEGLPLFVSNDVSNILLQPVLVNPFQFGLDVARPFVGILILILVLLLLSRRLRG